MDLKKVTNTLFVNLYGGPGVSKSTTAAGVFYRLKSMDINAELIGEYAKDRTWSKDMFTLGCQPYVTAKQLYRQYRVNGQVDIAVTDSPFILGLAYPGFGDTPSWKAGVLEQFALFNNLNIFLERDLDVHKYNPKGRNQNIAEAKEKDEEIRQLLITKNIPFHSVKVQKDMGTVDEILKLVELKQLDDKAARTLTELAPEPGLFQPQASILYLDYAWQDPNQKDKV